MVHQTWRKITNFPEIRGFGMGSNLTILSVLYLTFQVLIIVHNNKYKNKYSTARGI